MKKIRIGILAFLLTGITGLAAANNPFTDVPEGHWAYNSINKLVDAGMKWHRLLLKRWQKGQM